MNPLQKNFLISQLESIPGKISCYHKDLVTGATFVFNDSMPMHAASVIKLFIMVEAFRQFEEENLNPHTFVAISDDTKVPSCGALTYLHSGVEVTILDLISLMIILSDNTATNVLIDLLGLEAINATIERLGYKRTSLYRKMYDTEKMPKEVKNIITAQEIGDLLEKIYKGTLISEVSSRKMMDLLLNQQLNSKIPFYLEPLEPTPQVAHKTGESTGITHDVGIVLPINGHPFILCFLGNETEVCLYDRLMADMTLLIYELGEKQIFDATHNQNSW